MAQKLYNESDDYYSQLKSQCEDGKTQDLLETIDQLNEFNVDAFDEGKLKHLIEKIRTNAKTVDVLQELLC